MMEFLMEMVVRVMVLICLVKIWVMVLRENWVIDVKIVGLVSFYSFLDLILNFLVKFLMLENGGILMVVEEKEIREDVLFFIFR